MWLLLLAGAAWACIAFYRSLVTPLAKVPGPWYTLFTAVWLKANEYKGDRRLYIHDLHQRYGRIVRIGPNEVSFASTDAIKEIYTSSGTGYDKTEFYSLFIPFNVG
jgi:hypothetical protein